MTEAKKDEAGAGWVTAYCYLLLNELALFSFFLLVAVAVD